MRFSLHAVAFSMAVAFPNAADNSFQYPDGVHLFSVSDDLMQDYQYALGLYEDVQALRFVAPEDDQEDVQGLLKLAAENLDPHVEAIEVHFREFIAEHVEQGQAFGVVYKSENSFEAYIHAMEALDLIERDMPVFVVDIGRNGFFDLGQVRSANMPGFQVALGSINNAIASVDYSGDFDVFYEALVDDMTFQYNYDVN